MKYRKKPVVIDAVQYDGNFKCLDIFSIHEVKNFVVGYDSNNNQFLKIQTLEGEMIAVKGDWIIRGVKGEFYPCKPDIFEMTYEKVEKENIMDEQFYRELIVEFGLKFADEYEPDECAKAAVRYADAIAYQLTAHLKKDGKEEATDLVMPNTKQMPEVEKHPLWKMVEEWSVEGRSESFRRCAEQLSTLLKAEGITLLREKA